MAPTADMHSSVFPGVRLVTLSECGHFSYLECPDEVHKAVVEFLDATPGSKLA